jgi:hypothetical protein
LIIPIPRRGCRSASNFGIGAFRIRNFKSSSKSSRFSKNLYGTQAAKELQQSAIRIARYIYILDRPHVAAAARRRRSISHGVAGGRCLRPANLPRGYPRYRLCGGDRDRETENSKACARTRDTRFIQVRAMVANPTSCLGEPIAPDHAPSRG